MRMTRILAVASLGLLLGALVSCFIAHPIPSERDDGALAGVEPGDSPAKVMNALGKPTGRANGWWSGTLSFDMGYHVWYYKGKGRVVFSREDMTVYATQADADEDGSPN